MTPIATLSNSLDTLSKLIRVLEAQGITSEQLLLPVNNRAARRNLAEYLAADCPKFRQDIASDLTKKQDGPNELFEDIGRPIQLPPVESFAASEMFVAGREVDGMRVGNLGLNFKQELFGIVEENEKPIVVLQHRLIKPANIKKICTTYGRNNLATLLQFSVSLAHIYEFLKFLGRGRRGVWYCFFSHQYMVIADCDAVYGYWNIEAHPITYAHNLPVHYRIVLPDPLVFS